MEVQILHDLVLIRADPTTRPFDREICEYAEIQNLELCDSAVSIFFQGHV